MTSIGKNPDDPNDVGEFMETYKKTASHSQKFPEVCKNCKNLSVPVGYSPLREFKHTRLPFCGAEKSAGVGFLHAYFRDCLGYDPIVKDIAQKIDSKSTESDQTEADTHKGMKEKKAGVSTACARCGHAEDEHWEDGCNVERTDLKSEDTPLEESYCECKGYVAPKKGKKAAALPSADSDAVKEKDSQTGAGLDIRKWCIDGGHYARAGEAHPTHDWCTLWNTAVDNLVKLPSGAVIPRSMSGQSSESNGEGGPHQFGNTPNQAI